ncbi:MAG: hypothetical protein IKG93_06425 [Clostridiales bacterium]|nr:hypothetical protein [Clostridiales bacterium]
MNYLTLLVSIVLGGFIGFGIALFIGSVILNKSNNIGDDDRSHFDPDGYIPGFSKDGITQLSSGLEQYMNRSMSLLQENQEFHEYKTHAMSDDLSAKVEKYIPDEEQ